MRGERCLLSAGDLLVDLAARRLPAAVRDERRREWAAELPVILSDPEVKPAAARAVRMLWFAADTWRGTTLGRGRVARHRGTHRGPAAKWTVKSALWLGQGVALLTAMAVLLAAMAYFVYQTVVGVTLPFYVVFLLVTLVGFVSSLVRRQPAGKCWSGASLAASAIGQFVCALAPRLSWGHPLLFTVIFYCSLVFLAACNSAQAVKAIRYVTLRVRRSRSLP
jgi:hypothetical protein